MIGKRKKRRVKGRNGVRVEGRVEREEGRRKRKKERTNLLK